MAGQTSSAAPRAAQISACVTVHQSESDLASCLAGLRPFVDELFVLDAHSTDRSLAIAREYGALVVTLPDDDRCDPCQAVGSQASGEWLLWLGDPVFVDDSDAEDLRSVLEAQPSSCASLEVRWKASPRDDDTSENTLVLTRREATDQCKCPSQNLNITPRPSERAVCETTDRGDAGERIVDAARTSQQIAPRADERRDSGTGGDTASPSQSLNDSVARDRPSAAQADVDVIVLSYAKTRKEYEMTSRCLRSLRQSEPDVRLNVVVVETSSAAQLRRFSSGPHFDDNCLVVFPDREFNYNAFLQIGFQQLQESHAAAVLISNNDVVYHRGFAAAMLSALDSVSSASPWCPGYHENLFPDPPDLIHGLRVGHELCGWSILLSKELLERIDFAALFPDEFAFWYQDNFYSHMLKQHQVRHALVRDAVAEHLFEQSHDLLTPERRRELTGGAQRVYRERTGQHQRSPETLLTIAVPTIPSRIRRDFPRIVEKLQSQAQSKPVEILGLFDGKTWSIGEKRNALLSLAKGAFIAFVDDDDDVADDYIDSLLSQIDASPDVDCITFDAWVTQGGRGGKPCRYGVEFEDRDEADRYYRLPNHICCFRTEVARQCRFPDVSWHEDFGWARQMRSHIRRQTRVERVLYYYQYDPAASESADPARIDGPEKANSGHAATPVLVESTTLPVFGFMHVAMVHNWRDIVDEQLNKMHASGLYERAEKIFVGLVGGEPEWFDFVEPKLEVIHHTPELAAAEFPTLELLGRFCQDCECLVFYVHTKGVVNNTDSTRDWRILMEHFNLLRFQSCIDQLAEHDTCGINWNVQPFYPHYSGNFWWARSGYVRTLAPIRSLNSDEHMGLTYRHLCEKWIATNPGIRAACLYHSMADHYRSRYSRAEYSRFRPVDVDHSFHGRSAWKGLENCVQDLLEPVPSLRLIVEVGVEYGYSMFSLARAVPNAMVLGIDHYGGVEDEEVERLKRLEQRASVGNVAAKNWVEEHLPRFPNAQLIHAPSHVAASRLNATVDALHLDSVHTYEDVAAEFARWESKISRGGCVLFHDVMAFPDDVGRFFRELPGRKACLRRCHGLGVWYKP